MTDNAAPLIAGHHDGGPPLSLAGQLGQSLWETTSDAIMVIDPQGRIVHANAQNGPLFGFEPDELVGHRVELLLPAYLRLADEPTFPGQTVVTHRELTGQHKDGGRFPVTISLSPLPTENGMLVIATIRDVTNRKDLEAHARQLATEQAAREEAEAARARAEEALRASEERYRRLLETSPDAIVLTGLDTTVQMVNQQAVMLHGYEHADEMIGMNAFELLAPQDWVRARADLQRTLEYGSVRDCQFTLLKRDGTPFPAEVSGTLIRDAKDQPSAILTVNRDVTERVSAYQTLERRVEERTREIERRRQVAEAVRDLLDVLNSKRTLAEILGAIAAQASRLLSADAVATYQLQAGDGSLRVQAAWGLDADLAENLDVSMGIGAVGQAIVACQPVAVSDTRTILKPPGERRTTSARRARWERELTQYHSLLAVPLIVKGEVYGGLVLYYREAREFAGEDTGLADTFGGQAALAIENARLFAQIEQQMQVQEALYLADDILHRSLHVDHVLQSLVDVVIDILGADKSSVYVWDEQREQLAVRTSRGFKRETLTQMVYEPGEGVIGQVLIHGEPIAIEDTAVDGRMVRRVSVPEAIRSVIAVPIRIGDQIFGVFGVNYCRPRTFTADDIRLFTALAQRASMAIENARLHERALQAAALEERQRLARELHDSVTQSLYSLTLLAEAARRLVVSGDVQQAQHSLARLGETAQQALKEMRLLVYELRPQAVGQEGLVGAVRRRLDAVERRGGVQTSLLVDGTLVLPASVEDGLYGIIQEALNNAVKHALATVVTVAIEVTDEQVDVSVRDDGVGFDPEAMRDQGGIGLVSMRERAERLGATLVLDSALGAGTAVRVSLPVPNDQTVDGVTVRGQ